MARVLVTFATRKRLTSFVGRPDCLRRQAHPAPPSTPCIPPSRPSRSSTTSNGASRKMRRTRRTTPASAATASRSPARHSDGGGRAATRSCGAPGSSPASAVTAPCGWSRPMGKRPSRAQARAERFGWSAWRAPYEARKEGISPEAEGRAGWPNEVSPQGRKSPSGHHRLLVPWRRFAQGEHRHGHPDRLQHGRTHERETRTYHCFPRLSNSLCTTLNTSSK